MSDLRRKHSTHMVVEMTRLGCQRAVRGKAGESILRTGQIDAVSDVL